MISGFHLVSFFIKFIGSVKANSFWAPWAPWTVCSGSCGSGTQERERVCVEQNGGGIACSSATQTEERFCGLENCASCKYFFQIMSLHFLCDNLYYEF